jgi:hypothetical protein
LMIFDANTFDIDDCINSLKPGSYQIQSLDGSGKAIRGHSTNFVVDDDTVESPADSAVLATMRSLMGLEKSISMRLLEQYSSIVNTTTKAFPKALGALTNVIISHQSREDNLQDQIKLLQEDNSKLQGEAEAGKWSVAQSLIEAIKDVRDADIESFARHINNAPTVDLKSGMSKLFKAIDNDKKSLVLEAMGAYSTTGNIDSLDGLHTMLKEAPLYVIKPLLIKLMDGLPTLTRALIVSSAGVKESPITNLQSIMGRELSLYKLSNETDRITVVSKLVKASFITDGTLAAIIAEIALEYVDNPESVSWEES